VTAIAAAVAGLIALSVVVAPTGCASNCRTNCPTVSVYIGNFDNVQLFISDIAVEGPACPSASGVYCVGDNNVTTNCTHFTITGVGPGFCDVTIFFADRPAEVVHTQFGPPVQQGCCTGYSIVGDSVFVVPDNPDAAIGGLDGASDQVTVVVDGGTSDGNDADGETTDAGPDGADGN